MIWTELKAVAGGKFDFQPDDGSALEAIALADLMRNSQHVTYDEETKTIATNFRPTGEMMKEWPDLNKPEPSVSTSTGSTGGSLDDILKRARGEE